MASTHVEDHSHTHSQVRNAKSATLYHSIVTGTLNATSDPVHTEHQAQRSAPLDVERPHEEHNALLPLLSINSKNATLHERTFDGFFRTSPSRTRSLGHSPEHHHRTQRSLTTSFVDERVNPVAQRHR